MITFLRQKAWKHLKSVFKSGTPASAIQGEGVEYWENRARLYGTRAVLNLGLNAADTDTVTKKQKNILFPILHDALRPTDSNILDFGCGPGRFTPDLATLLGGSAIGADPIQRFLDIAPQTDRVEYRAMEPGKIPASDAVFDVVFACLVFGGITNEGLMAATAAEVERVLKPEGLLFLVENTAHSRDASYWVYRPVSYWQTLFSFADLEAKAEYDDGGQPISVMAGRKR